MPTGEFHASSGIRQAQACPQPRIKPRYPASEHAPWLGLASRTNAPAPLNLSDRDAMDKTLFRAIALHALVMRTATPSTCAGGVPPQGSLAAAASACLARRSGRVSSALSLGRPTELRQLCLECPRCPPRRAPRYETCSAKRLLHQRADDKPDANPKRQAQGKDDRPRYMDWQPVVVAGVVNDPSRSRSRSEEDERIVGGMF